MHNKKMSLLNEFYDNLKNKLIKINKKTILVFVSVLIIFILLVIFLIFFNYKQENYIINFSDIYNVCNGDFNNCNIASLLTKEKNNRTIIKEKVLFDIKKSVYDVKIIKKFLIFERKFGTKIIVKDNRGPFIISKFDSCSIVEGEEFNFSSCYEAYDFKDGNINHEDISFDKESYNLQKEGKYTILIHMEDKDKNKSMQEVHLDVKKADVNLNIFGNNTIYKGNRIKYTYELTPNNGYDISVEWKSSNPEIATVDSEGIVKGMNLGNTDICIYSKYYDKKACINIKVMNNVTTTTPSTTTQPILTEQSKLQENTITNNESLLFDLSWNGSTITSTGVRVKMTNTSSERKKGSYQIFAYKDGIRYGESGKHVYDVFPGETVVHNSVHVHGTKCEKDECTFKYILDK